MSIESEASLASIVEQTRAHLAALEELTAAMADSAAEDASFDEAFAARARSGELGRSWQVLQGRIDMDETSREAIMTGSDDSAEAHSVREQARQRVGEIPDMVRNHAEAEGRDDPTRQLAERREGLLARAAELQRRISDMVEAER